ncbi:g11196 [Coccomyxa elongata]
MAPPQDTDPLVGDSLFNYRNRKPVDVPWGILYLIFLALTLAGGVYGISNRNREFPKAFQQDYMADPRNCPVHGTRQLLQDAEPEIIDLPTFFRQAALWLAISAAVSLLLGIVFLMIFKYQPYAATQATIIAQVAAPAALGFATLFAGQVGGGLMLLGLAALGALAFYLWRNEIELCARLLGVAAHGLHDNTGLIVLVVVSKVVLVFLVLPIFGFLFASYTNGVIVPNAERTQVAGHQCRDAQGQSVPCCAWQADGWVPPYMSFASVTMLWTVFLFGQFRIFTISGTIAQWYFAPAGAEDALRGSTLRTVRFALGPQFGTLSLGAAVLTVIQIMRQALQQAQERRRQEGESLANVVWSLLACCLQCIWGLIEYITKFATVRAAITGEAFLEAGRNVTQLLTRNFLKAYGVWWFPPLVLQMAAFALSATWGLLIAGISYLAWHSQEHAQAQAALLGVLAFFMAWVVQAFFAAVLLDIVDAVFICYAMDKDTQSVTRAEVHEVFSQVPVGVAVEQPGGEYSYGAPVTGGYIPPSHPSAAAGGDYGGAPPPQLSRPGHYYDSSARV